MRHGTLLALLGVLLAACSGGGGEPGSPPAPAPYAGPAVVVLGFDGVDPDLVESMWAAGELPALRALAGQGTFSRLRTTTPPQSPVAWASFATGLRPGGHGVFDFVGRSPGDYLPRMGAVEYRAARFAADGTLQRPAGGANRRRGEPFWVTASRAGVPVRVDNVPFSWPPEPVPHGAVQAGLGTPDLRGTNSTATVFSTDFAGALPDSGGVRPVALVLRDGRARAEVEGPRGADGERARVPVEFVPEEGALRIEAAGRSLRVEPGAWSEWIRFSFVLSERVTAMGQARFFVDAAGPERVHVVLGPLGAVPAEPWVPLSEPPDYAVRAEAAVGPYKTVGWEEDTAVLNAELMPDEAWLREAERLFDQRTERVLAGLKGGPAPLTIAVWTGTDRVAHLFWRARDPGSPRHDADLLRRLGGDPVEAMYRRMDDAVARVRAALPPDTVLFVLSDHGFHGFRRGLHLNQWLLRAGHLALKDGATSSESSLLRDVDWSRTRAYALGTGGVYLNLAGREGRGIVRFDEAAALRDELRRGLLALRDERGDAVLSAVQDGPELFAGPAVADAPDLQLGFAPGWQASWATRLGGVPGGLFEDNGKKWSGDHAASDAADTEGVLLTSLEAPSRPPSIEDLAPSILALLGVPGPETDGNALWTRPRP